jgi:hypothetical protein
MNLRKAGGVAALILAAAYVVGLILNFTVLDTSALADGAAKVAFVAARQTLFHVQIFFIYIVFGVALVFVAQALDEQVRGGAAGLARTATAFALIWAGLLIGAGNVFLAGMNAATAMLAADPAAAAGVWAAAETVHLGLSGTAEIPGGLWTLLVSAAALRAGVFGRAWGWLGVAVGALGLLTALPALFMPAVLLYAVGHCVWWVWLAARLLGKERDARPVALAGVAR